MSDKTALYLRLSREDGDCDTESQSIGNQRTFLLDYAQNHGFQVKQIYVDDGWSGTTFERPGFLKLLADIEAGLIDTVLTKDLSRLGRDYIQTGHYLERYFPERRVRYIAVNDGIDTEQNGGDTGMAPFLSVMNDFYARDISRKVRTALTTKRRGGAFIGSSAPFGYQKDPADHSRLLPDPETAPLVREIFRAYEKNPSVLATANWLTAEGIRTPSNRPKSKWNDSMVRRILTNPTYAGHMTQNRSRTISYKVKKRIRLPKEEWMTVENTHEAIISQELFDQVQRLLKLQGHCVQNRHYEHRLKGMAVCGDCGAPMTFVRESKTRTYLVCRTSRLPGLPGQPKACTPHCLRESDAEEAVERLLGLLLKVHLRKDPSEIPGLFSFRGHAHFLGKVRIYASKTMEVELNLSDPCIHRGSL